MENNLIEGALKYFKAEKINNMEPFIAKRQFRSQERYISYFYSISSSDIKRLIEQKNSYRIKDIELVIIKYDKESLSFMNEARNTFKESLYPYVVSIDNNQISFYEIMLASSGDNPDIFRIKNAPDINTNKDVKWGYIDSNSRILLPPKYYTALPFKNGFARLQVDSKWAYINNNCEEITGFEFDYADDFNNNMARVRINNKWGFINESGNIEIAPVFDLAENFEDGLAYVLMEQNWTYIRKDGTEVFKPCERISIKYSEGLINYFQETKSFLGKKKLKWGYINSDGNWAIKPQYDEARPFVDRRAIVKVDNLYGIINKDGDYILEPSFDHIEDFSDELARVKDDGVTAFIDYNGNICFELEHVDGASSFTDGVATIFLNKKVGAVDKRGKVIIKPEYDEIQNDEQENIKAYTQNEIHYYSRGGKLVYKDKIK